jgi:hypothetical protein
MKAPTAEMCNACRRQSIRSSIDPKLYTIEGEPCRMLPLNDGLYAIVDANLYDYLMQWHWRAYRSKDKKQFYVVTDMRVSGPERKYTTVRLHQVVFGKKMPRLDHENRNALDNRRSNIRFCDASESTRNRSKHRNNTSGYTGTWKQAHSVGYQARIMVNRKRIELGTYPTAKEAAIIRDLAAIEYHGEFAVLNFPELRNNPELATRYLRECRRNSKGVAED